MTFHAPLLTPAHGFYALIAISVIAALSWIVGRARAYRETSAAGEDPVERQFKDIR